MKEQFPEEYKELNISNIRQISSDTEIPIHNNPSTTQRSLCTNFPENEIILDKIEAIKVITEISEDLNQEEPSCNIPQYIESLQGILSQTQIEACDSNLFDNEQYSLIENIDDLKKYLSELVIRFDTNPKNYTKSDIYVLLKVLYGSLIHLYEIQEEFIKDITVNDKTVPKSNHISSLEIGTDDPNHIIIETSQTGNINIKANVGNMNTVSNKLATINDIRNYITNKLSWQIYG